MRRKPSEPEPWSISVFEVFGPRDYKVSTDRPARLDCGARYNDIVRMTLSHAGLVRACLDKGWPSTEDIVGEVVLRVHRRQVDGKPYDPCRSSVGHYLHLITASILRNLAVLKHPMERVTSDGEVPRGDHETLGDLVGAVPTEQVEPVRSTRLGLVLRRSRLNPAQ